MGPEIGASSKVHYGVFKFAYSRNVYLYVGENGGPKLVGKFFKSSDPDHARQLGEREFNNLIYLKYMEQLLNSLMEKWRVPREHCEEFFSLREAWGRRGFMWEDRTVLVHGDPTPSNLLFGRGHEVIAIDLERMKWSDRVF
jgi:hypothetical protein